MLLREELEQMSHRELQILCKKEGLPANFKHSELIDELDALYNGDEWQALSVVERLYRRRYFWKGSTSVRTPQESSKGRASCPGSTYVRDKLRRIKESIARRKQLMLNNVRYPIYEHRTYRRTCIKPLPAEMVPDRISSTCHHFKSCTQSTQTNLEPLQNYFDDDNELEVPLDLSTKNENRSHKNGIFRIPLEDAKTLSSSNTTNLSQETQSLNSDSDVTARSETIDSGINEDFDQKEDLERRSIDDRRNLNSVDIDSGNSTVNDHRLMASSIGFYRICDTKTTAVVAEDDDVSAKNIAEKVLENVNETDKIASVDCIQKEAAETNDNERVELSPDNERVQLSPNSASSASFTDVGSAIQSLHPEYDDIVSPREYILALSNNKFVRFFDFTVEQFPNDGLYQVEAKVEWCIQNGQAHKVDDVYLVKYSNDLKLMTGKINNNLPNIDEGTLGQSQNGFTCLVDDVPKLYGIPDDRSSLLKHTSEYELSQDLKEISHCDHDYQRYITSSHNAVSSVGQTGIDIIQCTTPTDFADDNQFNTLENCSLEENEIYEEHIIHDGEKSNVYSCHYFTSQISDINLDVKMIEKVTKNYEIRCSGPDPEVHSLNYTIDKKINQTTGNLMVTVQEDSSQPYASIQPNAVSNTIIDQGDRDSSFNDPFMHAKFNEFPPEELYVDQGNCNGLDEHTVNRIIDNIDYEHVPHLFDDSLQYYEEIVETGCGSIPTGVKPLPPYESIRRNPQSNSFSSPGPNSHEYQFCYTGENRNRTLSTDTKSVGNRRQNSDSICGYNRSRKQKPNEIGYTGRNSDLDPYKEEPVVRKRRIVNEERERWDEKRMREEMVGTGKSRMDYLCYAALQDFDEFSPGPGTSFSNVATPIPSGRDKSEYSVGAESTPCGTPAPRRQRRAHPGCSHWDDTSISDEDQQVTSDIKLAAPRLLPLKFEGRRSSSAEVWAREGVCMFCQWSGRLSILGQHIRQEHASEIRVSNRPEWKVRISLQYLLRQKCRFPFILEDVGAGATGEGVLYSLAFRYGPHDTVRITLTALSEGEHMRRAVISLSDRSGATVQSWSGAVPGVAEAAAAAAAGAAAFTAELRALRLPTPTVHLRGGAVYSRATRTQLPDSLDLHNLYFLLDVTLL